MPTVLSVHYRTPTLTTMDPRGLVLRVAGYWRENSSAAPDVRVNRTVYDWAGRAIAQWDPRLFLDASAPANLQTTHALSGAELSTNSVDAGWRVALLGEAGQPIHHWDGRGSQRWMQYDTQLRPESVFEQAVDGEALCTERLSYGASDQAAAGHNQCGQLIRHDDPAGTQQITEFGLHGGVLEQTRHFLNDLTLPDWPESTADREWLLEPGEGATTRSQVNALGEVSHQIDAKGHRQLFSQTLDGQLREVRLQLNGTPTPKTLLSAITYNAHGQTEQEVAGNGVITTLEYDAQNGRLTSLLAQRGNEVLQDLRYAYDPVGNVLSIEDAALPTRYFANQRIEPISRYSYDSLSQLIEATGWEAGGANKGPQFSTFDDPAPRANYRQTYHYNLGGSLLELTHEGPQNHAHRLVAAAHSNRCLPVLGGVEPGEDDFRRGFDGNGNLLKLQPGQALAWDLRNQLGEVRPVERDSGLNDRERYVYGADGMRLRKVRETLAHARTLTAETRYLPNLELRNYSGTGEVLQVISVQAGRSSVRVLRWESETPKDAANVQYRYHLNDHLGSCTLELNDDGEVISQERYHPYGTTAWFAGRGEVEASYKTVRYSGKERDATGLYYYGFRYYVAGWQRWLNPDPVGTIDGLNLYRSMRNNPSFYRDKYGLTGTPAQEGGDNRYHDLASKGIIYPLQAAGMQPIRNYFSSGQDLATRAYRNEIPLVIEELNVQRGLSFINTHQAHVIAAVRTQTAPPSGAVLYHSGEIISGALSFTVGERATSQIMGPMSVIFNSPIETPKVLSTRREQVASTVDFVGRMGMYARHPIAGMVGRATVTFARVMRVSEAQTQMQYRQLTAITAKAKGQLDSFHVVRSVTDQLHLLRILASPTPPTPPNSPSGLAMRLFATAFPVTAAAHAIEVRLVRRKSI